MVYEAFNRMVPLVKQGRIADILYTNYFGLSGQVLNMCYVY